MYNPTDRNQTSMRDLHESLGTTGLKNLVYDLLEGSDELGNGGKPQMKPEDFSIKEIFEAVGPSTMPIITGTLISKKVMDAYELAKKTLDQLVTPFNSNLEIDKVPGSYDDSGGLQKVTPGEPYPHTGDIKEKYVQIGGEKRGEILDITEEMVTFDQTGLVMMQAAKFGERAAQDREKRGMLTIQDVQYQGGDYYAWYPNGTRVAIYSTSTTKPHYQSNQITNALADHTDIDAANVLQGLMKAENGDPIVSQSKILLTPVALETTAKRLMGNQYLVGGTNEEINPFQNAAVPVASPYLDLNSAIIWYWGDFKKQFIEKVVYPVQVMVKSMSENQDGFERDIYASYKVRHFTQVGATNFQYVIKSTGAA